MQRRHATTKQAAEVPDARLRPQSKLWLEIDGKIALSEWRVLLLEAVEESGSLASAAEKVGIPYRTASYKLREIETNLGVRLLATQSGGAEGGGSRLTPAAHEYIRRWRTFTADLDAWVTEHFAAAFAPGSSDPSDT